MTSVVQAKCARSTALVTSMSVTLNSAPTSGNLLVAVLTTSVAITSPVYPWGATPDFAHGTGRAVRILSKIAGPSESATVTFSNGSSNRITLSVIEVAPTVGGSTWAPDASATVTQASSVTSLAIGPTGSTTSADQVAVAGICLVNTGGSTPAWSNSYTLAPGADTSATGFAGYRLLPTATTTTTTGSWTTARDCVGLIATYKQTPAASIPAASGTITGSTTFTGTARAIRKATGSITGSTALAGAGRRVTRALGSITGSSTFMGAATSQRRASGTMTGSTLLAGAGRRIARAVGTITGSTILTGVGNDYELDVTPAERIARTPADNRTAVTSTETRTTTTPAENRTSA